MIDYRSLYRHFPHGIIISDSDGIVISVNEAASNILGISESEILNGKINNDEWEVRDEDGQVLKRNEFPSFEVLKTKNKISRRTIQILNLQSYTSKWILVSAVPEFASSDSVTYVMSTIIDITEQVESKKELKESELQYKSLFENSGAATMIIDKEGSFLQVNSLAAKNMGTTPELVHGQSIFDFLDHETASEYLETNKRIIESGIGRKYERKFLINNTYKIFHVNDEVIKDSQGKGIALQSSSIDVTEFRQIQFQFEHLLDNTQELIMAIKADKTPLFINPSLKAFYYKLSNSYLIQDQPIDFFKYTQKGLVFWDAKVNDVLLGNPVEIEDEIIFKGSVVNFNISLNPIKEPDGNITGVLFIASDITDKTKSTNQLRKAKEKAEENSRLKTEFINSINHEFRTPLNHVIGFSQIINNSCETEEVKKYSKIISSSGSMILSMIENILDFSIFENTDIDSQRQDITIKQLCKELTQKGLKILDQHNSELELDCHCNPLEESLTVKLKLDLFLKGIHHIIDNAVKYTTSGKVSLKIEILANSRLSVNISDTGIGIPEMDRDKVFNKFHKASNIPLNNTGIGLGLSIAKKVMTLLNGTIAIQSIENVGTNVHLTLPV